MSDLERKIASAVACVQVEWTAEHAAAVERSFRRRVRRRRAAGRLMAVGTALVLLVGGGLALRRVSRPRTPTPPTIAATERVLRFDDGSTATALDGASVIRAVASAPERALVAIDRGGGRFVVTKNPRRVFRVEAGVVAVEVLGTRFAVERVDERTRVAVDEGRVRVLWPGHTRELSAGESGLFPPATREEPHPSPPALPSLPPPPPPPAPPPPPRRAASWRDLAHDGDYDKAYEALTRHAPREVRDEPGELLLASDVARLSHHPADAVAPLRELLVRHRQDPRAPLAAFTLGRVFLEELGRPTEAAQAFADAESLAPDGLLAQDAIAREVEAWSRAGDTRRARERAEAYVRRYPDGPRLRSVRRFGGLD
jgi:transmembrane sensor